MLAYMKTTCYAIICLTALAVNSTLSQQTPPASPPPSPPPPGTPAPNFSERLQKIVQEASKPPAEALPLTKFNLDFPGGTPSELVAAIQKATGRPLNAIVPDDLATTMLPPLKMNSVDVSQLFQALEAASRKTETVMRKNAGYPGGVSYSTFQTGYGFRERSDGRPSDDTIWYFHAEKPDQPPLPPPDKVCRFYSLAPHLERGVSVDDITTAIETGWKMLGETSHPTISYHKDTKLLIAVGEPSKLETIDAVLKALEPPKPAPAGAPAGMPPASEGKPAEKPKTDK
jgi:hypothetical protein